VKLCYYENSPALCPAYSTPITKTNCTELEKMCTGFSNQCTIDIIVTEDFSEDVFMNIGKGGDFDVSVNILGTSQERKINMLAIEEGKVRSVTFGDGIFNVTGDFYVPYAVLTKGATFARIANMSSVENMELYIKHFPKIVHGKSLVIHGEPYMSIYYDTYYWIINGNPVSYRHSIPTIRLLNVDIKELNISKYVKNTHKILFTSGYLGKSFNININTQWDSDIALIFGGEFHVNITTASSIIPISFGENGFSYLLNFNALIKSFDNKVLSEYLFLGGNPLRTDSAAAGIIISLDGMNLPIILDSFVFGGKSIGKTNIINHGISKLLLRNTTLMSNSNVFFQNVTFSDPLINIPDFSAIEMNDVDLSSNEIIINANMAFQTSFKYTGSKKGYTIIHHPKKYLIKMNSSFYIEPMYDGKNGRTPHILLFDYMESTIFTYLELICVNDKYQDYTFSYIKYLGFNDDHEIGIFLNYTMNKFIPIETPQITLQSTPIKTPQITLDKTPKETTTDSLGKSSKNSVLIYSVSGFLFICIVLVSLWCISPKIIQRKEALSESLIV